MERLLKDVNVLDLTDEKGYLCGRLLADLGADVVKVEPPGGDPGRRFGPFYHDNPHPEMSLYWFAYNTDKRSITLNLNTDDGREILKRLLGKWDIVIESFPPGHLDSIGLGYQTLSKINPRLILTSITPYGQDGPYRDYQASDIELMAMGGFMSTCGEADRPPVRIPLIQSYLFASSDAAVGTLVASYWRELSGEGQQVDSAAEHSVAPVVRNPGYWIFFKQNLKRNGPFRSLHGIIGHHMYQCKDGWLSFEIIGGQAGAKTNKALVAYMAREGAADDFLKSINWDAFDMGTVTQETISRIEGQVQTFFLTKTMDELEEEALKTSMVLFPVNTLSRIQRNQQLEARNYWTSLAHSSLNATIKYPGPFVQMPGDENLEPRPHSRAPMIGEHNEEFYTKELGLSKKELLELKQAGII